MSIVYVGLDVHKDSFSACCCEIDELHNLNYFLESTFDGNIDSLMKYLGKAKELHGSNTKFLCGYEAGCLGYSLYDSLLDREIDCVIIAPTSLTKSPDESKKKNDRLDAKMLARNLACRTYKKVFALEQEDRDTREIIRFKNHVRDEMKKDKQYLLAFIMKRGYVYSTAAEAKQYWTEAHIQWIKHLTLDQDEKEIVNELLSDIFAKQEKIDRLEKKIEKLSDNERYKMLTDRLSCIKGITKVNSLEILVEVGDLTRFGTAGSSPPIWVSCQECTHQAIRMSDLG